MHSVVSLKQTPDNGFVTSHTQHNRLIVDVYISQADIYTTAQNYKNLLVPFSVEIQGTRIIGITNESMPRHILRAFTYICEQINNNVPLRDLIDENGDFIVRRSNPNNDNFTRAAGNIFTALANGQQDRNTWQNLVTMLGSSLVTMASQNVERTAPLRPSLPTHATPPVPATTTPIQQQVRPLQNSVEEDPQLNRFVENRHGAVREIIPNINEQPSNTIDEQPGSSLRGLQRLSYRRTKIPLETIKKIAHSLHLKILSAHSIPPNFAKKTKANYRKIKNYIHHNTKIWLSSEEIELFTNEMLRLNSSIDLQIDLDLD